MGAPSKDPKDYLASQPPPKSPPEAPWMARASRTWPKDESASFFGRDGWRRQAHLSLGRLWLLNLAWLIPLVALAYWLLGTTGNLWVQAVWMAAAVTTGSTVGTALWRAKRDT